MRTDPAPSFASQEGPEVTPGETASSIRGAAIVFLVLGYGLLAAYTRLVIGTDAIYSHLAYLPILLAGIWWGWRAVGVALALGLPTVAIGLLAREPHLVWKDVLRVLLFLTAAVFIALLRERGFAWQKVLQGSVAKYRLLVDRSMAGVFIYRDDRIIFANRRFCQMVDRTPEEMDGLSVWDLIHEEDRRSVRENLRGPEGEGRVEPRRECRMVRRNGDVIWVDLARSATDYEGEPAYLVSAYDITEKKRAEVERLELRDLSAKQELQLVHATRLAELGEMAAMIAHELNQPLTGIMNFSMNASYMLEKEGEGHEELRDNLRQISEQAGRAASIIQEVRGLTRRGDSRFEPIDVNGVVRAAVGFLSPQFRLANIDVRLSLDEGLPKVLGHGVRLEQVLLNLLANAKHAMRRARDRRLEVRTFLDERDPRPVGIEITDTGEGFDSRDAERLFQPFFTTKEAGHGTGLGLSISRTIIEEHRGRVEATGERGRGAKFTIRLPVPRAEEPDGRGTNHGRTA